MPRITILGTPVDFPDTGNSPLWSDAIVQFAQLVELALSGLVTAGDLGKEYFPLNAGHNPVSSLSITGFQFDPATVRSAYPRYYVYRKTDTVEVVEAGVIYMTYNPSNPVNSKWEVSVQRIGSASVTITVTDMGQVQMTLGTLAGTNHEGKVGFVAQTLAQ